MTNIHPSLLPAYGGHGMYGHHVHEAVLANHEAISGCSVHLVTAGVDEGPLLAQAQVAVHPEDTVATLAQRVLREEHRLYAETWSALLQGAYHDQQAQVRATQT
jgi:phosphoribosylglycinamide formyltransferase-1